MTHLIHLRRRKALLGLKIIIVPVHQPCYFASLSPSTVLALWSFFHMESHSMSVQAVSPLHLAPGGPLSSVSSPPLQKVRSWCRCLLAFYFLFTFHRVSCQKEQISICFLFLFFLPGSKICIQRASVCAIAYKQPLLFASC